MAAAGAAARIGKAAITRLERLHARLLSAEAAGMGMDAVRLNWRFHAGVYTEAGMLALFNLIQGLWLRTGPLLSLHYPHAPPT